MLTGPGPPILHPGTLTVTSPVGNAGSVYLRWDGTIAAPMAGEIEKAFEAFKSSRRRFVLVLNTGGGSVREGEKVIELLQRMRKTHRVDTAVERGGRCGSMCVPIYLQGETRFGARASAWLFHEITLPGSLFGKQRRVEGGYMRLIEKYWIPAGVPRAWIDRMLKQAEGYDYWQTGDNLIADQTNIITRPIENRTRRNLEADSTMPAQAKAAPSPPARRGPTPTPDPTPATLPPLPASAPSAFEDPFGGAGKRAPVSSSAPSPAPFVK